MTIYLLNIALLLVWGFFLLCVNPTQRKRKWFCAIAALQWILLSGLRAETVGADTDNYAISFNSFKSVSMESQLRLCWDYLFHGADVKDPGYGVLVKLFQYVSDDYRLFLFFVAAVFMISMAVWIYRNSAMPCLSFIIYSILFYSFFSVTGHRQTIATALIVFIGYKYVKERKLSRFLIIAFIAFMIHKSSIVFVPYYFIANFELKPIYVSCVAAVIAVVAALGNRLYAPVAEALGFGEGMFENTIGGTGTFVFLMLTICILSFCLYPFIRKHRPDTKFLYNLIFLTTLATLLVAQQQSFMRVQQYYSLVIMLLIPEFVLCIQARYRPLVYIAGVTVMLAFFISTSPAYQFFWQA